MTSNNEKLTELIKKNNDKQIILYGAASRGIRVFYNLIQKGVNKNPTEQTLRIMADNMDMPFDELIEGTEWEIPRNTAKKSEYAFSQTECVVHIDDSGKIKTRKQFPDLVINISEDAWFGQSIGPYQHFAQAIYRSVEEGVFVARSANKGISGFIDPNGRLLKSLKINESGNLE